MENAVSPINLSTIKPAHASAEMSDAVEAAVDDMFYYHPWNEDQTTRGTRVREALIVAVLTIIRNVPASPDRSTAIRKLREARMDCNSAITHDGRY